MTVQHPPGTPRAALTDKLLAGGLSSVPVVGGVAAAWYQNLMEGPYNRRLDAWRQVITEVVNDLAERYDNLLDSEVFLDAFVNATRAAQATHEGEKLEALRNAVANSVAPDAPQVGEQARFFRLVDQFSAAHIVLLKVLDDPRSAAFRLGRKHGPQTLSLEALLDEVVPQFVGNMGWRELLISDLVGTSLLVDISSRGSSHPAENLRGFNRQTTGLGRRFLRFISADN
ncbi:hypothetical protein [Kribbella sindirgiensis]|uniref:Uncharacterized protein n=1 Tax=Kribbella sindirgiensis TaxID=1124744 RepID=A0A4R0IEU6_9ACTN|nr:hypothetical protein [Kribbella sindirgiensis]TCC30510.1 hypothetical protein E0H50_24185 [Kribbella sindirgiensis]